MELNDKTFADFIKSRPLAVVESYAENCPACLNYEPIFAEVEAATSDYAFASIKVAKGDQSDFVAAYMQKGDDGVNIGTPMTFVFENGALKYRYYGMMTAPELTNFIATGSTITGEEAKAKRIEELDAIVGRAQREMGAKIKQAQEDAQVVIMQAQAELDRITKA